jgi:integrase
MLPAHKRLMTQQDDIAKAGKAAEPPAPPPRRSLLRTVFPGLTDEKLTRALAYIRLYAAYAIALIILLALGTCIRVALY